MEITKRQLQENYNQSDVDFVFDSNPKLSEIGTKEEYSQYLDTIFPSSKIREIFFHRSRSEEKFNSFDLEKVRGYGDYGGNGFYFAPLEKIKNLWKKPALSNVTNNIVSVLLDIKNPWRDPQDRKQYDTKEWNEYINTEYNGMNNMFNPWYDDKDFKNKFDAIFDYNDYNNYERLVTSIPTQVLVYRPNQIHILGSKQDIEGFKKFVNNTDMEITKGELEEEKKARTKLRKKKKADRCLRIAKRKYDVWPSAYSSAAVVRCRRGKIWKGLKENWEDTSWANDGEEVTLKDLLNIIKNYPIVKAPIEKVKKIVIKKDSGGIESNRLNIADFKYPIIIIVDDSGNYQYILDGNHRANKAIDNNLKFIPAKLVNIKNLPQEFQNVLAEDETLDEKWSQKYKRSIDCNNPKGFSQKAHCKGKLKEEEGGVSLGDNVLDKTFIHETNADFDKFDLSKFGSGQGEQWLGNGIYLQEKGSFKIEKYGKNKIETTLNPNAKIFNIKNTPNGKYRDSFIEWAVKNTEIGKRKAQERIDDGLSLDNLLPRDIFKRNTEAVEKLKEQGYDGLYQDGELVVYNPNVLQIKSIEKSINEKTDFSKEKEQGLHGWFARQGGKGKSKGWVDCNTCRDGKCKSCGRKEGESRSKYPACRPTPSACKTRGKGKSWGKKSKLNEDNQYLLPEEINEILKGYIEAALWTEEERLNDEYGSEHNKVFKDYDNYEDKEDTELDKLIKLTANINNKGIEKFSKEDIEPDSLIKAYTDIKKFIQLAGDSVYEAIYENGLERLGTDIWFTRNGHGAGFFDHSYDYDDEKKLIQAGKSLGSVDLYINDNLKLSFSNQHLHEQSKQDIERELKLNEIKNLFKRHMGKI